MPNEAHEHGPLRNINSLCSEQLYAAEWLHLVVITNITKQYLDCHIYFSVDDF